MFPYSVIKRFWYCVRKTNTCWLWTRHTDDDGYGSFCVDYQRYKAHRFSYLITKGEPGELFVCHHCDNPSCVNPEHLFLGTAEDNIRDMHKKGRAGTLKGEDSNLTKLSQEQIDRILRYKDTGRTQQQVADEFGINRSYVSMLWGGKRRA